MEPVGRTLYSLDWITLVILISLIFLAIAKRLFYGRFLNFLILPFNNRYIFMYNKKDRLFSGFQVFFSLFQIGNTALFIYLAWGATVGAVAPPTALTYLVILGGILAFALLKLFLQMANAYIFNNERVISEIIFKKLSYLNYSGLAMFLANVVLVYIQKSSAPVVYVTCCLVLLINGIGWITLVKNHQKLITSYFFYFILYLCALEIAPLVLLVNALTY